MVRGILADANVISQVRYLVHVMQTEPWTEFWQALGLTLCTFDGLGLATTATDREIWERCQSEELILITDNRNEDSSDSLSAAIRDLNVPGSLPVFTIGSLDEFAARPEYVQQVVETLYDYLLRIDEVRGTGRLFLP
jgi:hypothetical protein